MRSDSPPGHGSRDRRLDLALGALLGLAAGVGAAVLRGVLDADLRVLSMVPTRGPDAGYGYGYGYRDDDKSPAPQAKHGDNRPAPDDSVSADEPDVLVFDFRADIS